MDNQESIKNSNRKTRGRPRDWHDKTAQNTIKSLDRAMAVFEYLSKSQGKSLSTIADELDQSPATVYRILITLEGRGLVEFSGDEQLWFIGPQSFVIGSRFLRRTSLVDRSRPILRKLMETTGETANLGVERDGLVLFLTQVETQANIRAFFAPGTLSDMHASGIGKVLLAFIEHSRLGRMMSTLRLESYTNRTITSLDALKEDLIKIRTRGYSVDDEEKNSGMRCIAAPIFDVNQEAIAGISVSGPSSRVTQGKIEALSRPVMEAAQELTLAIGGEPPHAL